MAALEAGRDQETVAQLAVPYEVHRGQVQAWKNTLTKCAAGIVGEVQEKNTNHDTLLVVRPCQEIGQLKVEQGLLAEWSDP